MKVLITLPVHHYYQLLASCEPSSREYKILTAPFPNADQNANRDEVHIFCDSQGAEAFVAWAKQIDPSVASEIRVEEGFLSRLISKSSRFWISLLGFALLVGGLCSLAWSVSAGETPQLGMGLIVCGFAIVIAGEMMD